MHGFCKAMKLETVIGLLSYSLFSENTFNLIINNLVTFIMAIMLMETKSVPLEGIVSTNNRFQ